jgi:hypothetical protein
MIMVGIILTDYEHKIIKFLNSFLNILFVNIFIGYHEIEQK